MKFGACFLVSILVASGCLAGNESSGDLESAPGESKQPRAGTAAPQASAAPGLGALTVVVTTSELAPVLDVEVVLAETTFSQFTDEAGRVTFNDLEPGTYTILVAKPGYRSAQEKGRLVNVPPDEVVEVKLVMDPIPVIDASNAYHKVHRFIGYIACSFEGKTIGYTSYCGRGLDVAGQNVGRDPNENSTHPWTVENIQLQGVVLQAKWQPSFPTLGSEMRAITGRDRSCGAYACTIGSHFQTQGGPSPITIRTYEGTAGNLTKSLGKEPSNYPRQVWSEARAYCNPSCQINILLHQRYDMWASAFYGQPPPDWYSALPPE